MFESLVRVLILGAVLAAVILAGWDEPLRYRALDRGQIAQEEQALAPKVEPRRTIENWQPAGTSLDRAPYRVRNGMVRYSRNFDPKQTGTGSETPWKPNTFRGGTAPTTTLSGQAH